MKQVLARIALAIYPGWWEQRYGDELRALLEDSPPDMWQLADLFRGALVVRLTDTRSMRGIVVSLGVIGLLAATTTAAVFLFSWRGMVVVRGHAMAPALEDGERVHTFRASATLARGDIVVFRYPPDPSKAFVKRIVGLPGEQVRIDAGRVSIDGQPLDEPYVAPATRSEEMLGPTTVPEGYYFVLGDNRRNSSDSRHWGPVARGAIVGVVED